MPWPAGSSMASHQVDYVDVDVDVAPQATQLAEPRSQVFKAAGHSVILDGGGGGPCGAREGSPPPLQRPRRPRRGSLRGGAPCWGDLPRGGALTFGGARGACGAQGPPLKVFSSSSYMLLQPKNRKYRKDQKGSKNQKTVFKRQARSHRLSFGSYGLKSLEANWLKASQLEAVRRVIIRDLRKIGHIWIRTFPHKPVGKKPTKTRMGKGKGSVQYWVCPILPGQILFEINGGISKEAAKHVLERASQKLPVITQFVSFMSASLNPIPSLPSTAGDLSELDLRSTSFGTWPGNASSCDAPCS